VVKSRKLKYKNIDYFLPKIFISYGSDKKPDVKKKGNEDEQTVDI